MKINKKSTVVIHLAVLPNSFPFRATVTDVRRNWFSDNTLVEYIDENGHTSCCDISFVIEVIPEIPGPSDEIEAVGTHRF
jgi:hypothetical protein